MTKNEAKLSAVRIRQRLLQDKLDVLEDMETSLLAAIGHDPDKGVKPTVEVKGPEQFDAAMGRMNSSEFWDGVWANEVVMSEAWEEVQEALYGLEKWQPLSLWEKTHSTHPLLEEAHKELEFKDD